MRDGLDLPRVTALRLCWQTSPPLASLMRAAAEALGVEFTGGSVTRSAAESGPPGINTSPEALIAEFGGISDRVYRRPALDLPMPAEETATDD